MIRSAIFDAPNLIQPDYSLFKQLKQKPYGPRLMIYLLLMLMFLHCFWTCLIIKTILRTLKTGHAADIRSDDDEDNDNFYENKYNKLKLKKKKIA